MRRGRTGGCTGAGAHCAGPVNLVVGRRAEDATLSLATQGASARPEPVLFLGTRAFVHGDVDNCLERSAP